MINVSLREQYPFDEEVVDLYNDSWQDAGLYFHQVYE